MYKSDRYDTNAHIRMLNMCVWILVKFIMDKEFVKMA